MERPFYFRHFKIWQQYCAMKVGTDSMLLGAIARPGGAQSILDIGTGSGVLSLMLAQKSKARIQAIDIDEGAARQAAINFKESAWAPRLAVQHISLQQYASQSGEKFDMIISNPPYFAVPPAHFPAFGKGHAGGRIQARSTGALNWQELLQYSAALLQDGGSIWLVIPAESQQLMLELAGAQGLQLLLRWQVSSLPGQPPVRCILCLGKMAAGQPPTENKMAIYASQGVHSAAYMALTFDYHALRLKGEADV